MSEGRSRGGLVAGVALILALAAGGAAGYVYHRQNTGLQVLVDEVKRIRGAIKGAKSALSSMEQVRTETGKSIADGMRGLWLAVRDLKKDFRKLDARLARIEGGGGGSAMDSLRQQVKQMRAKAVLLQARVEALERLRGGRSKTVFVPNGKGGTAAAGGSDKGDKADGKDGGAAAKPDGGTKSVAAASGQSKKDDKKKSAADQPPFWDGCIDSLNKSARLAQSAESVCDCIIGRLKSSDKVSDKDRKRILARKQFTTRVRGVSKSSQRVLEQAVVQCALRQFKKK